MSLQECEVALVSSKQLEMKFNLLHWLQNYPLFPIKHNKWIVFL